MTLRDSVVYQLAYDFFFFNFRQIAADSDLMTSVRDSHGSGKNILFPTAASGIQ